jgi:hypothetical protein
MDQTIDGPPRASGTTVDSETVVEQAQADLEGGKCLDALDHWPE